MSRGIVVRYRRLSRYATRVHTVARYCCAALDKSTNRIPISTDGDRLRSHDVASHVGLPGCDCSLKVLMQVVAHLVGAYEEWARGSSIASELQENLELLSVETISLAVGAIQGRLNLPAVGAEGTSLAK